MKRLDEVGIEYIYPEGAFYVYVFVNRNSMDLSNHLLREKLLVMPSQQFGDEDNAIRISYAADIESLEKGLKIFTRNL
jgi:aspartate/methionine/tyrosine aminotransferase